MIQTTPPAKISRRELLYLLKRWKSMGIEIAQVNTDPRTHIIQAKLQSHNAVRLKAMKLEFKSLILKLYSRMRYLLGIPAYFR